MTGPVMLEIRLPFEQFAQATTFALPERAPIMFSAWKACPRQTVIGEAKVLLLAARSSGPSLDDDTQGVHRPFGFAAVMYGLVYGAPFWVAPRRPGTASLFTEGPLQ